MVTPPLRYAPPRPTSYVLPILTSLILLLCALFHPARSQDDGGGNDPGYRAPMRNITCPGPAPPFRLPIYPTLDLNSLTLQTLCAAPRYGGLPAFSLFDLPVEAAIRFSTGFYCLGPLHPENAPRSTLPDVAFDTSPLPPVVPSTLFDWVRLNLFCRERCFCSNVTGTSIALKPYGFTDSQRLLPVALGFQPYSVRELRLHEDNRLTRLPFAISNLPKSAIIWHSQRRAQSSVRGELTSDQVTISLSPRNWIACLPHTPIPPLRMPPPYTDHNSDFRSLRELCAVSLDGGNPGANAGAYCHPASPHARGTPRRKSQLWFSDAATPRLEWTWTHGFRFAAQLRAYCFAFCWCASEEPQPIEDRAGYAFLRLLEDVDLVRLPSGQGVISRKGGGEVVLPKMGAGHRSCAQDTSGSCPAAGEGGDGQYDYWPTAVLGPAPGSAGGSGATDVWADVRWAGDWDV
ncbi:MAG: hypothetical protein M1814_005404 [Vezdaea aestivalis]|nr:MAG: hypothetical protein M1814_005404 [Vezdaea aestivalis]